MGMNNLSLFLSLLARSFLFLEETQVSLSQKSHDLETSAPGCSFSITDLSGNNSSVGNATNFHVISEHPVIKGIYKVYLKVYRVVYTFQYTKYII